MAVGRHVRRAGVRLRGERRQNHRRQTVQSLIGDRLECVLRELELDTVEVHHLTVEGHLLVVEEPAHDRDDLAHHPKRLVACDPDLGGKRVPPGTEAGDHPTGGEVVDVKVGRCNGDEAVRRSLEAAAYRASPLPQPPDPALFDRNLVVTFRPQE